MKKLSIRCAHGCKGSALTGTFTAEELSEEWGYSLRECQDALRIIDPGDVYVECQGCCWGWRNSKEFKREFWIIESEEGQ